MQTTTQTPERSPSKRAAGITQAQKQLLIDNLQLEITERARKLRAQYATQAHGLRERMERRVNRIPQALRKRNMQDLVDEHVAKSNPAPPPPVPVTQKTQPSQAPQLAQAQPKQNRKRKSDEMSTGDDKENVPSIPAQDLANPKKRTKTAAVAANSKATRTRNAGPAGVLSPKSHNSRTLPHSPIKTTNMSPEKTQGTRPVSAHATVHKTTRAPRRQTKRPATALDSEGRTSEGSTTSAGTTVVTKPGARKAAVPKKAAPSKTTTTAGRKLAVSKVDTALPAAATRTLRKRN